MSDTEASDGEASAVSEASVASEFSEDSEADVPSDDGGDGASDDSASDDGASDDEAADAPGVAPLPAASAHDWPGPSWGAGSRVPLSRPWVEEREVPRDERRLPDTMSMFEFARLVGLEAEHDRESDDAVTGAMRKVLEGRSALTIRRVRREVPPTFAADGGLKTRGYRLVEVWPARELHYPHATAERA